MALTHINFLAVAVAGLAAWALGALWYSPILFGKSWQKALGFTDEYLKEGNMAVIFGTSFMMMLVMSFGMAALIFGNGGGLLIDWKGGLIYGLTIGILFVGPSIGINYLFQRKTMILFMIDAIYQIIFMAIIGLILGAWH